MAAIDDLPRESRVLSQSGNGRWGSIFRRSNGEGFGFTVGQLFLYFQLAIVSDSDSLTGRCRTWIELRLRNVQLERTWPKSLRGFAK
jgi:hypothetical protein